MSIHSIREFPCTHMGNNVEEMDTGSVQSQYLLISAAFDRKEAGPEQRPFA